MGKRKSKKAKPPASAKAAFKAPAYGLELPEDLQARLNIALVSRETPGKALKAKTGLQLYELQKIGTTGRARDAETVNRIAEAMDTLGVTLPSKEKTAPANDAPDKTAAAPALVSK